MKKIFLSLAVLMMLSVMAAAEDAAPLDPNKLFYSGNAAYEKRDYEKALAEYAKILDTGIESAGLYYNMGNCYFKMSKLGYAILFYDRAERMMPHDSDLRANLNYALSLVDAQASGAASVNALAAAVKAPFKDFSLNAIAVTAALLYILFIIFLIFSIVNPVAAKKARPVCFAVAVAFVLSLAAFAVRYYDEEILRRAIVVVKDAECKYEPIDKSTTFYRLKEGEEVSVMSTASGWRRVKRADGRAGWLRQDAVEEI